MAPFRVTEQDLSHKTGILVEMPDKTYLGATKTLSIIINYFLEDSKTAMESLGKYTTIYNWDRCYNHYFLRFFNEVLNKCCKGTADGTFTEAVRY
jgi:hypothetical protein